MNMLAILLAASATTGGPTCTDGADAALVLATVREEPTPFGLILGMGSDWGSKFVVVTTTHRLGVPGIAAQEGRESVAYYAAGRDRVCTKQVDIAACPHLELAIRAYRGRSYDVMYNRSQLRRSAAYHPPFAILHARDGDGNLTKIVATQSEHPLLHDTAQTFESIQPCIKEVDEMVGHDH